MARKILQEISFPGTGKRLREARLAHGYEERGGLSLYAEQAGLKDNTYGQNENGIRRIDLDAAIALCKTFGLTLDYIYLGDRTGLPERLKLKIGATDCCE